MATAQIPVQAPTSLPKKPPGQPKKLPEPNDGRLVEVMQKWRFTAFNLWVVHVSNRYLTRPVRVFKEFAAQMAPTLFPSLPA